MPSPARTQHAVDLSLVREALRGSAQARETVARRLVCIPRFLARFESRGGHRLSSEDLADLAQDTALTVWGRLDTFEGRSTLESWAWTYCRHAYWNRLRRLARSRFQSLDEVEERDAPQHTDTAEMDHDALERGLKALPMDEEEVIRLKHLEGLMFREIADRLKISPNTVKTRYYRGLAWLKEYVASRTTSPEEGSR